MKKYILSIVAGLVLLLPYSWSQNIGIGVPVPLGKLHIKGAADVSQLIIDAHSPQGNASPLMKLRNSLGNDLLWMHSDTALNTFVGIYAGRLNYAVGGGVFNTFNGSHAGYSNTVGNSNSGFGANSLFLNATGSFNSAYGLNALFSNASGAWNTAIGANALFGNTIGGSNTAVGNAALLSNSDGSSNTAIGTDAMKQNSSGSGNTASGFKSLLNNTTGSNNTAIGNETLNTLTTGNNNTAIGYRSNVSVAAITNATAIGAHAYAGASNSVVLGSINGINGATANANIGIGMTTPTKAKLEVHGAVDATSAIFGGESSGISIQRNWPGIGFNSYYEGGNRYLANGFAAKQFLDPLTGYMYFDMFSSGVANGLPPLTSRALTIAAAGRIGIGTATPNGELQLPNTLNNRKVVLYEIANNNFQYYGLGIESGTMRYSVGEVGNVHRFYAGSGSNSSALLMSIWGNKSVIISDANGGGRLGINTGFPEYTIEALQAGGRGLRLINPGNGYHSWEMRTTTYSSGNSDCLGLYYDDPGNLMGWFRPTDGGYSQNSDRRLKEDILPLENILDKLLLLEPTRYHFLNDKSQQNCIGFISQDVQKVFPELVDVKAGDATDQIQDHYGLNYSSVGVIAIKAIQEQQLIIEQQQAEIDELKKRLDLLEKKIMDR